MLSLFITPTAVPVNTGLAAPYARFVAFAAIVIAARFTVKSPFVKAKL